MKTALYILRIGRVGRPPSTSVDREKTRTKTVSTRSISVDRWRLTGPGATRVRCATAAPRARECKAERFLPELPPRQGRAPLLGRSIWVASFGFGSSPVHASSPQRQRSLSSRHRQGGSRWCRARQWSSAAAPRFRRTAGSHVYASDSLRTGNDGRVGVTLSDDTQVSIGPRSEVRLDSFVYDAGPGSARDSYSSSSAAPRRTCRASIAKLAPDAVRLETPAAIVGVRGTTLAVQVTTGLTSHASLLPPDVRGRAAGPAAACVPKRAQTPQRRQLPSPDLVVLLPDPGTSTAGRAIVSNRKGAWSWPRPAPAARVSHGAAPERDDA